MLNKLRFERRLPLNTNILNHWVSKRASIDPSLMKVVNVVFAAPATQVPVERIFSSVKFILKRDFFQLFDLNLLYVYYERAKRVVFYAASPLLYFAVSHCSIIRGLRIIFIF